MSVREYIIARDREYQEKCRSHAEKESRLKATVTEKEEARKTRPLHFDGKIDEAFEKRDRERDRILREKRDGEKARQARKENDQNAKAAELKRVQENYKAAVKRAEQSYQDGKRDLDQGNWIRRFSQYNKEPLTDDDISRKLEEALSRAEEEKDAAIKRIEEKYAGAPQESRVDNDETRRLRELDMACAYEVHLQYMQKERCGRDAQADLDKAKKDLEEYRAHSQDEFRKFLADSKVEIDRRNVTEAYAVGTKTEEEIKANPLPQTLCIGAEHAEIDCKLTRDVYRRDRFEVKSPLSVDIRGGQNILINVSGNDYYHNAVLERTIAGITLRYLETFPPEALSVHVVYEHEVSMVFETLKNVFKNCGKENIVSCGSRLSERLGRIRDYINNNISRKMTGYDDIYEYFQDDQSGLAKMHLVVILNGFGHEYANDIKEIADLMQDKWRVCGLRFLIVNDYVPADRRDDGVMENIKKIEAGSLILNFHSTGNNSGFFERDDLRIQLTTIPSEKNAERFVEEQCGKYIRVLDSTKRVVTYEDIGFGKIKTSVAEKYSSEISIPIGKSGNAVYEIPFHCESHNGRLVKNHLAVGSAGSGKSSLLHAIILNGAMKYSPEDLQFWLLDLKEGSTSTHYLDSKIPHIRMVASKNTSDDIYSMLLSVAEEWRHRQWLFEEVGKKYAGRSFNCIHRYNQFVDSHRELQMPHLSRIVILIDEAQDIFNDESVGDAIDILLGDLVAKTRYVGIHFFLFANPLTKAGMKLNNGYISQCDGQFFFRLAQSDVENVNFDRNVQVNAKEIGVQTFPAGHVFGTVDKKAFDEIQVAFFGDITSYEKAIAERYATYPCDRIVMGKIDPLLTNERATGTNGTYRDLLVSPEIRHEEEYSVYRTVFGSESFSTAPLFFEFSPKSGAPRIVGTNYKLASSVAHSMVDSLARLRCEKELHIVKGRGSSLFAKLLPPQPDREATYYSGADIDKMIYYLYEQLCSRKEQIENDFVGEFKPIFAFVNDLASLEKVVRDVPLEPPKVQAEEKAVEVAPVTGDKVRVYVDGENYITFTPEPKAPYEEELSEEDVDGSYAVQSDTLRSNAEKVSAEATYTSFGPSFGTGEIRMSEAIKRICKDGPELNIYLSFYTSKQVQIPTIAKILNSSDQVVIVNNLDSSIDFEGENAVRANLVASMLKKIQASDQDTQAVWVKDRTTCYKVRPIVYIE